MSNPLINRMSTDNINVLLVEIQKYPTTIQSCIDDMMEKSCFLDLKYETVCTLNDVFGVGYNPSGISTLFENIK